VTTKQRVLILGADGFIGRHVAFAMRAAGLHVIAHARNPSKLAAMGFETLTADLRSPKTHEPTFWEQTLKDDTWLVNAAGLLNGSKAQFQAVHVDAPKAAYAAMTPAAHAVLISAIGIEADTNFGYFRRLGEAATTEQVIILRPGLVMADTSYGGSSLARSLAALPLVTPVVGDGEQRFNPIHANDLATVILQCLQSPVSNKAHIIGGPEIITQTELLVLLRSWLGLRNQPLLRLPVPLAMVLGAVGDVLRLGPISKQAVAQLQHGVLAPTSSELAIQPRGVTEFVQARPAGTQDIWHARLYLMRPMARLALAFLWLASGVLGLTLDPDTFLPLLPNNSLSDQLLIIMARIGGLADLAIALALLRNWRPNSMTWVQLGLIGGYTLAFTTLAPVLWLLPLGGLLKNLPLLVLVAIWGILEHER
jgi:uncharacterized protein YbjT (DUF2867 family)